ncbi:MAG: SMC family ATPase [Thermoproteota archaeon]|nr:SMC family ATPase [Thermoproteota archaeon]
MRIHKISLENFASYNKESLDIDSLGSIINVFGSTGAGKTTLLVDSISFCLFGKAYGEDEISSGKRVIRPNQGKAKAEIEFSIDDKRYKIIREVYKDATSKVLLLERIENEWRNKAIGTKEVQNFVENVLNMDYDIFLNSIAIRQGDVVSLLEATASERREIFLKLLNLDFKKEKEKVGELRDKIKGDIQNITGRIYQINEEIKKEEDIKKDIKDLVDQLKILNEYRVKIENEISELEKQFLEKQNKYNDLKTKLEIYYENKRLYDEKKKKEQEYLKEIENVELILKEGNKLQTTLSELTDKLSKLNKFKEILVNLKFLVEREKSLQKDIIKLEEELKEIENAEKELREVNEKKLKLNELDKEIEKIKSDADNCMRDLSEIKAKLEQVKRLKEALENANIEERRCPLCGSPLNEETFDELFHHFIEEESKLKEEYTKKITYKVELDKKKEKLEKERDVLNKFIAKEDYLKKIINKKDKNNIIKEINTKEEELKKISQDINNYKEDELYIQFKDYQNNIDEVINKTEELREQVENDLRNLSKAEGRKREIVKSLEDIRKEIALLEEKFKEKPDENLIRSLEDELKKLESLRKDLDKKINEIARGIGEINGKIKEKEDILKKIEEYKFEKEKLEKELENKNKRLEILNVLYSDIFNERGFPLSLLDDYLNDLNQIANSEYLAPLLKNKRVEIKRVEDKIEIKVFDDIYERDLSTYSGGEKTAIGFALRLAIAKTLTLRRGISPKFLIIDEGFGPLSLEIRDLILRLILNLKDEYEKIFVVSHLEDIQENPIFDSVIRIYKDENNVSHIEKIK